MADETVPTFAELNLPAAINMAIDDVGYESPSPIQAQSIPPLLAGRDLLGHAQTGTGKTAAFACRSSAVSISHLEVRRSSS